MPKRRRGNREARRDNRRRYAAHKGQKIYNKRGEEVILRGVNLGTWLIHESWMTPIENSDDNISTLNTLTERFGVEKAYELINIYEDNWITEYDLDRIVELGFNCVRVPFWFRNFYYDDKGTKSLTKRRVGFQPSRLGRFRML